jgi:4,5-dihydroxyphthalate decarboxylase
MGDPMRQENPTHPAQNKNMRQSMANLPLTLTCADYARVMPLAAGAVQPDGIELTLLLSREGSWPGRAEMLRRAATDPAVHGGESSMAGHLRRIDKGDRSLVALPIFPLRNFTGRDLYVRKDGSVQRAADLIGRRIGLYDWVASGAIWYRHFLRFVGVQPDQVEWWIGPVDEPDITNHVYDLPRGVHAAPAGHALSDLLLSGEIDALYSPPRPHRYHPVDGPIVRLFADFRSVECEYFRQTRMFPPQHLIVLRRAVWEANRWSARSLTDAFIRCNHVFHKAQRSFPYSSPWEASAVEEMEATMGADPYAYGFDANRETIEVFCEQARALGIVARRVTAEEYFAEYLEP